VLFLQQFKIFLLSYENHFVVEPVNCTKRCVCMVYKWLKWFSLITHMVSMPLFTGPLSGIQVEVLLFLVLLEGCEGDLREILPIIL